MDIPLLSKDAQSQTTLPLPKIIIDRGTSPIALYHAVNAELANRRLGTAATKERSAVTASNAKPWRQKGTGRARAGSRKSPIWRGGGTVFGPHPRSYRINIAQKQRAVALCSALRQKAASNKLFIIDPIDIAQPKTKLLSQAVGGYLQALGSDSKTYHTVLIIIDDNDTHSAAVRRAGKNIPISVFRVICAYHCILSFTATMCWYTDNPWTVSLQRRMPYSTNGSRRHECR